MTELLSQKEEREIMPGFRGRFIHSEKMSFAFWSIDEGSQLPEHKHPHEQVVVVQSGSFELTINGNTEIYKDGKIAIIPSGVVHSGIALSDCKILDVFTPVREDYL